jgi:exopolyphosphatase/guanosine-5'-triphosphate,3'-diphosphate pyrophosphatase
MMRQHDIQFYRAVATSAVREAENGEALVRKIFRETGIRLEAIDSAEEARLVRRAVRAVLGPLEPRLVVDLGGGSLEISLLHEWRVEQSFALPIGTVRLMESMKLTGMVDEDQFERLRHRVLSVIQSAWPNPPNLSRCLAVFCGGNAELLARVAPGPRYRGVPSIHVRLLRDQAWEILRRDVPARMRKFQVRRDRAEVLGIAAVVFLCLAEHARLETILVPSVGVREGILCDLAAQHFGAPGLDERRARVLLDLSRNIAAKFHCDVRHADYVRSVAAVLFDQLAARYKLAPELRLALEMAAELHNCGRAIHEKAHHKHGEYLVQNAELPGLPAETQAILACLVRYHGKSEPEAHHKLYASLPPRDRRRVRELSGILRIAAAMGAGGNLNVRALRIRVSRKQLRLRLFLAPGANLDLAVLRRKARPFEKEFGVRVVFTRTRAKLGAPQLRMSKVHRVELSSSQKKSPGNPTRPVWGLTA